MHLVAKKFGNFLSKISLTPENFEYFKCFWDQTSVHWKGSSLNLYSELGKSVLFLTARALSDHSRCSLLVSRQLFSRKITRYFNCNQQLNSSKFRLGFPQSLIRLLFFYFGFLKERPAKLPFEPTGTYFPDSGSISLLSVVIMQQALSIRKQNFIFFSQKLIAI